MTDLTLRPVDPDADAELLHLWVTADRAEFWGMQDTTVEQVREIYTHIDGQDHLRAYLVEVGDSGPVGLFQTYDPRVDEIGEFYDRREGDAGVHLFLADTRERAGRTVEILGTLLDRLFDHCGVQRVVLEPDVANTRSIALLRRLGAEPGPATRITTSYMDKEAQFHFLTPEGWRRTKRQVLSPAGR